MKLTKNEHLFIFLYERKRSATNRLSTDQRYAKLSVTLPDQEQQQIISYYIIMSMLPIYMSLEVKWSFQLSTL